MNNPELRFKNDTSDWKENKLLKLTNFETSSAIIADENGKYIIMDMGTVNSSGQKLTHKKTNNAISCLVIDDLVMPKDDIGTGLIICKTAYIDENNKYVLGDHIYKLHFDTENGKFMHYLINSIKIQTELHKYVVGSAIKGVSYKSFKDVKIAIPEKEQQYQIANLLSNIDIKIEAQEQKLEKLKIFKKSMLGKMFPKDGERVPQIRFSGFTDDWEQRKLGDICERVTRKNKNNESDLPLTIASQFGLIDQRDFFNKVVAAKDMSNYYLLKKGEFAYNKSYSNGFDYGSVKRLNAYEQGCLSTLYICFGITSDEVESDYLECFFDTLKWYGDVSMICAEGARNHGLLNVDTKGFFDEVTIDLPRSLEEQKKISAYLNALDNLVTLHQRKLDKLKEFKKALLDKILP